MVHQLCQAYGDMEQYTHQLHQEIREKEDLTMQIRDVYECLRTNIGTSCLPRQLTPRRNCVRRTPPRRPSPDSFDRSACAPLQGMTFESYSKLLQQKQQCRKPPSQSPEFRASPEFRTPRERLFQEGTPHSTRSYSLGSLSRRRTEDEFWAPYSRDDTEKPFDQGIQAHTMLKAALSFFESSKGEEASVFGSKAGQGAHRMYQLARGDFWNQTSKDGTLFGLGLQGRSPNKCRDPNEFARHTAQLNGRKVGDSRHRKFDDVD